MIIPIIPGVWSFRSSFSSNPKLFRGKLLLPFFFGLGYLQFHLEEIVMATGFNVVVRNTSRTNISCMVNLEGSSHIHTRLFAVAIRSREILNSFARWLWPFNLSLPRIAVPIVVIVGVVIALLSLTYPSIVISNISTQAMPSFASFTSWPARRLLEPAAFRLLHHWSGCYTAGRLSRTVRTGRRRNKQRQ